MKKIVLLLVFFYTVTVSAQVIIDDKTRDDGTRSIMTRIENFYNVEGQTAYFSLYTIGGDKLRLWSLFFSLYEGKLQFEKGNKMLIKFDDGTVMELENNSDVGPYDYSRNKDGEIYVTIAYRVTPEQLREIADKRAIKVRVGHKFGYFDRDIDGNKFSIAIKYHYSAVEEALSKSTSFYDNF